MCFKGECAKREGSTKQGALAARLIKGYIKTAWCLFIQLFCSKELLGPAQIAGK